MNIGIDEGTERYEGGRENEPEESPRKGAVATAAKHQVQSERQVFSASGRRWLHDFRLGQAHWRFPEPQRPCSPARETQPAATPASPGRPARVRFPQRGTGTKPLHTQWPGSARGTVCNLAPRAAALTSGQRGSVIDRHPDLLHPALSQFQRHFRSCTRRPAATPGKETPTWGEEQLQIPPEQRTGRVRPPARGWALPCAALKNVLCAKSWRIA